jgi:hypothetical protein
MSYYDTLAEDLARAKQILAEGEGNGCGEYRPDHNGECLNCDEWADAHGPTYGKAIYGKDIYAAYMLLQSFVEAIEAVDPKVCELAVRHARIAKGGA